MIRSADVTQ